MKPSWEDAPEWAQYLAMDHNGIWHWYEEKPALDERYWMPQYGRSALADRLRDWNKTLEEKPA